MTEAKQEDAIAETTATPAHLYHIQDAMEMRELANRLFDALFHGRFHELTRDGLHQRARKQLDRDRRHSPGETV